MNNLSQRNIVLIAPVGNRDPWDEWKEVKEKPEFYGAALSIIEKYSEKIQKVIFITTIKTEEARPVIDKILNQDFPEIQVEWRNSKLDKANDLNEIHKLWDSLLRQIKLQETGKTLWLNISSGTPQMSQYLTTRIQLGFFGELFEQAFPIEVSDPKFKNDGDRVIMRTTPTQDPIQEMLDASHIEKLMKVYDYHAASALIREESNLQKLKPSLEFLKDAMDLNFKSMDSQEKRQKLSSHFQSFIGEALYQQVNYTPDNENKKSIMAWLAYCAVEIKFNRKEYQDALLRFTALREDIIVKLINALPQAQPFLIREIREGNEMVYLDRNKLTPKQCQAINSIGVTERDDFSLDYFFNRNKGSRALLMSSTGGILLTFFLTGTSDEKYLEHFKINSKMSYLRNTLAHGTSELKHQNKIEKLPARLTAMFRVFAEKTGMTIDIEKNFFDLANRALLQEHELDWLIDKNGRSTHGNRAKTNPEKTPPTKQETCPV